MADPIKIMVISTTTNSELLLLWGRRDEGCWSSSVKVGEQRVEWIEVYLSPGIMGVPSEIEWFWILFNACTPLDQIYIQAQLSNNGIKT